MNETRLYHADWCRAKELGTEAAIVWVDLMVLLGQSPRCGVATVPRGVLQRYDAATTERILTALEKSGLLVMDGDTIISPCMVSGGRYATLSEAQVRVVLAGGQP